MDFDAIFAKHKVAVLEFSGGKDSLACLYLLKPWWDRFTVLWVNTGDAFPETIEQLQAVERMVPHFTMVWTGQPKQIAANGYPADIFPFWDSPFGREAYLGRTYTVQSPAQCCAENIWLPMNDTVKAMGATLVIRGQRNEESRKAPIRSGCIADGIEYLFPIEDWSTRQVLDFLVLHDVQIPSHYAYVDSSLDCQHCTAYLDENQGKFSYMAKFHPDLNEEVKSRIRYILRAAEAEMAHARAIVE